MNEKEKLYIYIDESSTLGFKSSEPYFIVCALILNEDHRKPLKKCAQKLVSELRKSRICDELHANEMTYTEKQFCFEKISAKKFSVRYLVAHKESIHKNLLAKKNVCFNYFVSLLLENLLEKTHIEDICITIDTRSIKVTSEKSLEEYLNTQLVQKEIYNKNIFVSYGDSKNHYHLQIVDLFANAIFAKYTYDKDYFYKKIDSKISHRELFPQRHFDKSKNSSILK
ncbi:MAG: DUF3800 domain-containing protein [Candidatus Pacebacteria bacterium]|nr:DUF3800 domain-containing protein [Candidatus Paceibacterota bacterium]MBP9818743.1 DUF3800 domain-containing protein [Candidatus Paceibacterota bacterium]